jgi:hypothetical protein
VKYKHEEEIEMSMLCSSGVVWLWPLNIRIHLSFFLSFGSGRYFDPANE